jgi:hypothetical protein
LWKDLTDINLVQDLSQLKNHIILAYLDWTLTEEAEDIASINLYWRRSIYEQNTEIWYTNQAQEYCKQRLFQLKNPRIVADANILPLYRDASESLT